MYPAAPKGVWVHPAQQTPCYMEAMNLFNFSTEARLLRLANEDAMHDLVSLRRIVCEQKSFPLEGTAFTKWLRAGLYHLEISFVCLTLPQSIGRHLSTMICLLRSSWSVWAQQPGLPGPAIDRKLSISHPGLSQQNLTRIIVCETSQACFTSQALISPLSKLIFSLNEQKPLKKKKTLKKDFYQNVT